MASGLVPYMTMMRLGRVTSPLHPSSVDPSG